MDLFLFLLTYVLFCAALIWLSLFGTASVFVGTPIASLHWVVFHGTCDAVCSNPALQVFYLGMLAAGYFFYCRDLFCFLPQPYAPLWHQCANIPRVSRVNLTLICDLVHPGQGHNGGKLRRFTGALALGACLAVFGISCWSDPGTITAENLGFHTRMYPHDPVAPQQSEHCWTCQWKRPARSKHCSVCKRCVARLDHHCAWINNCVGLLNLKYFLGFLVANVVLTTYAVGLGCVIMKGELDRRNAWQIVFRDPASGQICRLASSPRVMLRWLLHTYPIQVALLMFLALGLVMVAGFMAHQLWLIGQGTTTYESYKRTNALKTLLAQQLAEQHGPEEEQQQPGMRSQWLPWPGGRGQSAVDMPANIYDRGLQWNFKDALMPVSWQGREQVFTPVKKRQ